MKSTLIFFILVAVAQGVPLTRTVDERIVNGKDAKLGEIPYQVSLQTLFDFHFCGGSVLNENYVVTAAHCVQGKEAKEIKVVAGTINLTDAQSVHFVINITIHAQYNPTRSWSNDIAVIKVREPFKISKTISYVPLPKQNATVPANSPAVVSGWGRLWQGGPNPKKLQRTSVLIADRNYCNKLNSAAGIPVYECHVCAYDPKVATGPCHGDSGGPLTVNGILVGVASFVIRCGSNVHPTVYTRVPDYIDWIKSHAV